jgi:hypothetical protein
VRYLERLYVPEEKMLKAPGPLWIDVLVRENYASDTNAMMVGALDEFADVYVKRGDVDYAGHLRFLCLSAFGIVMLALYNISPLFSPFVIATWMLLGKCDSTLSAR